jgi:hypothetical protein
MAPSIVFAIGATAMGASSSLLSIPASGYIFVTFIWFLHGVVVAYPATLFIGIPGYLIYKMLGLVSFKSYAVGGAALGTLSPLLLMPVFGVPETLNFNLWIFVIGGVFGFITSTTFWYLSVRNPNNQLNPDAPKSSAPVS